LCHLRISVQISANIDWANIEMIMHVMPKAMMGLQVIRKTSIGKVTVCKAWSALLGLLVHETQGI
jgi:hypothetical protein